MSAPPEDCERAKEKHEKDAYLDPVKAMASSSYNESTWPTMMFEFVLLLTRQKAVQGLQVDFPETSGVSSGARRVFMVFLPGQFPPSRAQNLT